MLDAPETLTDGFHDFDEETQKVITRVQVEESRAIDAEHTPVKIVQLYVMKFWKRFLEAELAALEKRTDISNEEKYVQRTRFKHDLASLAKGWEHARPMLETRLHSDVDF